MCMGGCLKQPRFRGLFEDPDQGQGQGRLPGGRLFRLRRVTWKSTPSNQGCLLSVWPDFVGFPHSDEGGTQPGAGPFWLLFRLLEKVTRRKGGTIISTPSNNRYPSNLSAVSP